MLNIVNANSLLLATALSFIVIWMCPLSFVQRHRHILSILVISFFQAAEYVALFRHSPFGLNAYFGDQHYIISAVTKFQHFSWDVDFNYNHMASYYPPLYFYVLGKLSGLQHITAYTAVKYSIISAALLVPIAVYLLWIPLAGRTPALFLATFVQFACFDAFKVYEYVTVALFLPWWLYFGERKVVSMWISRRRAWLWLLVGGMSGGLIFQMYYYDFFVLFIYLFVRLVWNGFFDKAESLRPLIRDFLYKISVLFLVAVFSADYWLPVIVQSVQIGYENFQNTWIAKSMLTIHFFDELAKPTIITVFLFAGLIYFVMRYRSNPYSRILLQLLMSCYVWYLLGFVGIPLHKFNLFVKLWTFNDYLLAVGMALLIGELSEWEVARHYVHRITLVIMSLVILGIGEYALHDLEGTKKYANTLATKPPRRMLALESLKMLDGKTLLTDNDNVTCFIPVYAFLGANINYANPAALYDERVRFLQELSRVKDEEARAWLLEYNKFDPVTYLWMPNGGSILYSLEDYPKGTKYRRIGFGTGFEHSPYFTRVEGSDVYQINRLPEEAYRDFDLYALSVAYEYADQAYRSEVEEAFTQQLTAEQNPNTLRQLLGVLDDTSPLYRLVAMRITPKITNR